MKPSSNRGKDQIIVKKPDSEFKSMVEGAKFKEKLFVPHSLSIDVKVWWLICEAERLRAKKAIFGKRGAKRIDRLRLMCESPN